MAVIATPLLLAVALPTSLLGSAPREHLWHTPAAAVRIVDGETIGLGDRVVRLAGIEAPPRGASCHTARGEAFDCGAASAAALARLLAGQDVSCRIIGKDDFGRGLGKCAAGGTEVNRAMVQAGFARARHRDLREEEDAARRDARGLWAHGPGLPPDWRAGD
jgi:endonuclease YncB( thermonuclease family)